MGLEQDLAVCLISLSAQREKKHLKKIVDRLHDKGAKEYCEARAFEFRT